MGAGKTEAENDARLRACQKNGDDCQSPLDGGWGFQLSRGLLSLPSVPEGDFGGNWEEKI